MPADTAAKSAAKDVTDFDDLKEHMQIIREEIASLAATTAKLAVGGAKKQAQRVGDLADATTESAAHYRDIAAEKVKAHPFAAIGIAALAGLVIASMSRR